MEESIETSTALTAAQAGAAIVAEYFKHLSTAGIENKSSGEAYDGIVTRADVESERAIVTEIRKSFPKHEFLAEEEHLGSNQASDLWVIDPLDGTNNFAHNIPHFAVSVAYYRNGKPQSGVVLNPINGDVFLAEQGKGAWWNGRQIHVNQHSVLSETMLGVGFYYDRGAMMRATLDAIEQLFGQNIHGIRRMGTAALDIVQVAIGRFGGFFEYQLSPWDFAAARLFLEEAGGTITTCKGTELPLEKTSVLASNSALHAPLLEIVAKYADY